MKCWNAEIKNRPTAKVLFKILYKWNDEISSIVNREDENRHNSEIYSQVEECDKIGEKKFKNKSTEDKQKYIQSHPQAIYTSRLINFKNLLKPVNSTSIQINPDSECLDVQLSELELSEICQSDESN
ncbi:kinase-like domain-containing protein [Rhizophagus clarus]|nr:kinase-like domain-containing protein [Rhizophagus clarus]